jgi:hypothetical protein
MPSFSEVENRRPPGSIVVPPAAFADTWQERPDTDVCMGLRFVADEDLEDARVEAFKRASRLFPNHRANAEATELWSVSFQDALIRWIVARGTCDPNDVQRPWSVWGAAPEDIVQQALTDMGAQRIFDAWEQMRIAADIGLPEATDDDLALLPLLLARLPTLAAIARPRALRVRRLLRFVLEELESVPPVPIDPSPASEAPRQP